MERIIFLIEDTGQRIPCLLNPENLNLYRVAGVRPRRAVKGAFTGAAASDDQLLFTGGGNTELQFDLLFDISLVPRLNIGDPSSPELEDIRELTAPLWELAENSRTEDGFSKPPLIRFVWGKSWNIPGIIVAMSDRLECFTVGGVPQRSWLRVRFRRVAEPVQSTGQQFPELPSVQLPPPGTAIPTDLIQVHPIVGGSAGDEEEPGNLSDRLDVIAHRYYGSSSLWKSLAAFNDLDNPLHLSKDLRLQLPPVIGSEAER